jgi:hypothetical protein
MHWTHVMPAFVLCRFANLVGEESRLTKVLRRCILTLWQCKFLSFLTRRLLGHGCTTTHVSDTDFGLGFASLSTHICSVTLDNKSQGFGFLR